MDKHIAALIASNAVSNKPLMDFEKEFDRAAARNKNINDKTAEAATRAANAMIDLKTAVENTATKGFGPLDTAVKAASGLLKTFNTALDDVNGLLKDIENSPLAKWVKTTFGTPAHPTAARTKTEQFIHHAEHIAGRVVSDEAHKVAAMFENPFLHSPALLPLDLMNPSLADFVDFSRSTGSGFTPSGIWQNLLPSPTSVAPLTLPPFVPHALPIPPSLGALTMPGAGGAHHDDHSLTIGNMTVNTQATDANGVAAGMHAAVARKFNVSQADSGVTQ